MFQTKTGLMPAKLSSMLMLPWLPCPRLSIEASVGLRAVLTAARALKEGASSQGWAPLARNLPHESLATRGLHVRNTEVEDALLRSLAG
jgi:hypothetical protein